ncbi:hypothetical protein HYH03_003130 [Edaphochlamys debaryana]|uniref:Uncharacterized protein n=1 Tax=Edaphochlamys debaryana TaxID=47281 RepID=A0A836C3L8_9CHLO|nr:hypothetical protein HYH03_003130 [Edaphochlamys debaryana]|eukprot:KAG2498940.1 hypothetical protein HYH03_003130 [Edaphochlamys debaryana]
MSLAKVPQCGRAVRGLFPVVVVLVAAAGIEMAAARDGRALLPPADQGDAAAPSSKCKAVALTPNTARAASGACGCTNGWTPGPNGGCVCAAGKTVCPSGACVTLGTNSGCKACGDACAAPFSCLESGPFTVDCACPQGQFACGQPPVCTPVNTDQNCGNCGIQCTKGNTCQTLNVGHRHLQSLAPPGVECRCPAEKTSCADGSCVTLGTDANCASCGDACGAARTCQELETGSYACVCPGSQWYCNGQCVDLGTNDHCSG